MDRHSISIAVVPFLSFCTLSSSKSPEKYGVPLPKDSKDRPFWKTNGETMAGKTAVPPQRSKEHSSSWRMLLGVRWVAPSTALPAAFAWRQALHVKEMVGFSWFFCMV